MIEAPKPLEELFGRTLMLNIEKVKRFQCGGFALSMNNPIGVVPERAQVDHIRAGLLDGRLLDVTEQHIKGFKIGNVGHTKAKIEDTGKKVYLTVGQGGSLMVIAPKDESEVEALDAQLQKEGVLITNDYTISDKPLEMIAGVVRPGQAAELMHTMSTTIDDLRKKGERF